MSKYGAYQKWITPECRKHEVKYQIENKSFCCKETNFVPLTMSRKQSPIEECQPLSKDVLKREDVSEPSSEPKGATATYVFMGENLTQERRRE